MEPELEADIYCLMPSCMRGQRGEAERFTLSPSTPVCAHSSGGAGRSARDRRSF